MLQLPSLLLLLLLFTAQTHSQKTPPYTGDGYQPAATDSYGLGLRLGVYFQTAAYILGFFHLLRFEVRSQITGIIIGFQIMIRWSIRMWYKELSPPEAWIILAMALMFTTPGIWLLTLVFHAQRVRLRISRREVIKGQGLNIFLSVVTVFAVIIANVYWSISGSQSSAYPSIGDNPIWFLKTSSVHSTYIRVVLGCQAFVTLLNVYPGGLYLFAWFPAIRAYLAPHRAKTPHSQEEMSESEQQGWLQRLLDFRLLGLIAMVLFLAYSIFLGLSVELTIIRADLRPVVDVAAPGQLIPLLTGTFALISSLAEFLARETVPAGLPVAIHPVTWAGSPVSQRYQPIDDRYEMDQRLLPTR